MKCLAEEYNYQMAEKGGYEPYYEDSMERFENTYNYVDEEDRAKIDDLVDMFDDKGDNFWRMIDMFSENYYRIPAILEAQYHSDNGGNTFMYYWQIPSTSEDYNYGACHAVELSYVFNNLDCTIFTGENPSEETSMKVMEAWSNFARTGDPSIEGIEWPEYNSDTRETMMIDEEWSVKSDPDKEIRLAMMELVEKYGQDFAFILEPKFKETDMSIK